MMLLIAFNAAVIVVIVVQLVHIRRLHHDTRRLLMLNQAKEELVVLAIAHWLDECAEHSLGHGSITSQGLLLATTYREVAFDVRQRAWKQ